ncbi:hypothetical protein Arno162_32 [Pectobacterium phage Arno162]|uniref:Uncharacterized protein n=1 Tax=Pectobacterium phage Arno162 TaxID=2500577 RepID=A0A678ZRG9_9CAUD|nr:hypothetical protein Arno162_32 [Pectobacterium phage Arno162]
MTKSQFVALVNKSIEARKLSIHDINIGSYAISALELASMRAQNAERGNTGCYTESSIIKFAVTLDEGCYRPMLSNHLSDEAMQASLVKFTRWLDEMKAAQPLSDVKELDSTVSDMAREVRLNAELAIQKAEKRLEHGTEGYVIVTPDLTCAYNHRTLETDRSQWEVYMVSVCEAPALTSRDSQRLWESYSEIRKQLLVILPLKTALEKYIEVQKNILKALTEQGY